MNTITPQIKKELESLVKTVQDGIVFLMEQEEYGEDYLNGIRQVISYQISSALSRIFLKDSTDTDTVGSFFKLYGVDSVDILNHVPTKEKLMITLVNYIGSEEFNNM